MFKVGKTYNRRKEIHGQYKGQQYGGIATPSEHPYVFIFTSDAGEAFGYNDDYGPDDTFWYTGEGQVGDMKMAKGNLAIRDHEKNNKEILLFESEETGYVRFVGKCEYITHHIEDRPDKNNEIRDAIVFHLNIKNENCEQKISEPNKDYETTKKLTKGLSLKELRKLAIRTTPTTSKNKETTTQIQYRTKAIKLYAKKRANGLCEGCGIEAPFSTKKGPYLEVHHMFRLADGGPDHPLNVIALCPTCHRRAHYAIDSKDYNAKLIKTVENIENKKIQEK